MSDESNLSTAKFLSQLRELRQSEPAHDSTDAESLDEINLDFSDLDDSSSDQPIPPDSALSTAREEVWAKQVPMAAAIAGNSHLEELFQRVHSLLSDPSVENDEPYRPRMPETLDDTGLIYEDVERLILKFLNAKGAATGRQVCAQIRLPFRIIESILKQLKREQFVALKGAVAASDYEFTITERGRERARTYAHECTYFGSAPVCLRDYLKAMATQSIARQQVTENELREAFADLVISQNLLDRLGPAINSGRGMFLFGEPGNGKTSLAERVTRAFPSTIWIPRALGIDGDIIRLYDPGVHEAVEEDSKEGIFDLSEVDQRWVRIVRPTVTAGGELTMSELEVTQNLQTKICEAPLQLKSNCGTLVIDDFGRQRMPVDELLNRWIVPLEKRYDFLSLPSGKKIQVPFDQLIIFSTNLEPKDLVDAAFLRRIPYKIHVDDPSNEEFHELFQLVAPTMGFAYDRQVIEELIEKHYRAAGRTYRACHPRDLLAQVRDYCGYKGLPRKLKSEYFDHAVQNYFSIM